MSSRCRFVRLRFITLALLPTLITLWLLAWLWNFLWTSIGQYVIFGIRLAWYHLSKAGILEPTSRGDILYALLLAKPGAGPRRLHALATGADGLGSGVRRVSLLGRDIELEWKLDRGGLEVTLPAAALTELPAGPVAVKIES